MNTFEGAPNDYEKGEGNEKPVDGSYEKNRGAARKMDEGMPAVCKNVHMRDGELNTPIQQGLEELARKGISINQFVGEVVLEAAVNIIDEAADIVMEGEGVDDDPEKEEEQGAQRSSQSVSYNTWVDNLKNKVGNNSVLLKLAEEAKLEVESFFDNALKELGRAEYDLKTDELVHKANGIFLRRMAARGNSEELGLRSELRGERDRADDASSMEKTLEREESSSREVRKNARSKTAGIEGKGAQTQESQGSLVGKVDNEKENKEGGIKSRADWMRLLFDCMKHDKGFAKLVMEALREINEYLWTVYDKGKKEYSESNEILAMKAATILMEKARFNVAKGKLDPEEVLGRCLKANPKLLGYAVDYGIEIGLV
nr:hypothetical protein Iba_chr01aCG5550 [Ipomoea batatas]